MRGFLTALLISTSLLAFSPVAIAQQSRADQAKTAYLAAGSDAAKLQSVIDEFPDEVWAKFAASRLKIVAAQQGKTPEDISRQIAVEPKQDEPAPAPPAVEAPAEQAVTAPQPAAPVATLRVAADGTGTHKTIAEAVAAAATGSRIEIYPGTYTDGVTIDIPLDIIGVGDFDKIIWSASGSDVVRWRAESGSISNLTLQQLGGCDGPCNAIYFDNGSATVENMVATSQSGAVIYLQGAKAAPTIRSNNIYGSLQGGVFYDADTGGTLELNEIYDNTLAGIEVKQGAHPLVKGNIIRNGKQGGVFVHEGGRGLFMENQIHGNVFSGIEVKSDADPVFRNNDVYGQVSSGVYVSDKGRGLFINNSVHDNGQANVFVGEAANPVFRVNKLFGSKEAGIVVETNATGTFESNDIAQSGFAGVEVRANANPIFRNNKIYNGVQAGVMVHENGLGQFEDNDIYGNKFSGVDVKGGGNPTLVKNRINANTEHGLIIGENGKGTYTDNDLTGNALANINIDAKAGTITQSGNKQN